MFIRFSSLCIMLLLAASPLQADTVHISADRDATLIEDANGAVANGSGPAFFAGRTNQQQFSIRRALIRFDVAAALPERAIIDRVFLSLYQASGSNTGAHAVTLHRVLQDWSEGPAFSSGGSGAASGPGDVTWLHTRYDNSDPEYWTRAGGHFIPHASTSAAVGGKGFYTWQSSASLVSDVVLWLHAPQRNFGWLIMGEEDTPQNSKRFASREAPDANQHPMLTIEYHLPGE